MYLAWLTYSLFHDARHASMVSSVAEVSAKNYPLCHTLRLLHKFLDLDASDDRDTLPILLSNLLKQTKLNKKTALTERLGLLLEMRCFSLQKVY